jgi:7-cyano-7-deazaguanine synthase
MDVRGPVGVLCSGGLDSAVLLIELARAAGRAVPLFVRAGHPWEPAERASLERFLAAVGDSAVAPVRELSVPMADVYGDHWSITGDTPDWHAPDERSRSGRSHSAGEGIRAGDSRGAGPRSPWDRSPAIRFPTPPPGVLRDLAAVASRAAWARRSPSSSAYRALHKDDVIRRGQALPLYLTLSSKPPDAEGRHCGACNKCRERAEAFATAGVPDRTVYVARR